MTHSHFKPTFSCFISVVFCSYPVLFFVENVFNVWGWGEKTGEFIGWDFISSIKDFFNDIYLVALVHVWSNQNYDGSIYDSQIYNNDIIFHPVLNFRWQKESHQNLSPVKIFFSNWWNSPSKQCKKHHCHLVAVFYSLSCNTIWACHLINLHVKAGTMWYHVIMRP